MDLYKCKGNKIRKIIRLALDLSFGLSRIKLLNQSELELKTFRSKQQFLKLCFYSRGGYYHDIPIGRTSTFSLFGVRHNSPNSDINVNKILWDEIADFIESNRAVNILEIGPAEGFFSFNILKKKTCFLTTIQPRTILDRRFRILIRIGNFKNVTCFSGNFPNSKIEKENYDLILALGVLYHAENAKLFLNKLLDYKVPIVLETIINSNVPSFIDGEKQRDGYGDQTGISESMIKNISKNKAFKVKEISNYNALEITDPNSRFNLNGVPFTRKGYILIPN
jgi:hypothetical protein